MTKIGCLLKRYLFSRIIGAEGASMIAVALFSCALLSCSVQGPSGKAEIGVRIGGAVPRVLSSASSGARGGSRLILSATARIRLSAEVGEQRMESLTDYVGAGTRATLSGLPVNVSLLIGVETLDVAGNVLTSWSETRILARGRNEISATLRPEEASVLSAGTNLLSLASVGLDRGSAAFYSISFSAAQAPSAINEYQIIANTGSFRSCWLAAYDADWNPISPVARDEGQGWTVLRVPQGGGQVFVAITALEGSRTATLQARRAYFYSESPLGNSSNPATSASPRVDFQNDIAAGRSYFIAQGDYTGSATINADSRVYGGFSSGDWSLRDPSLYGTKFTSAYADTGIDVTAACCLDGLTVQVRDYPGAPNPGDRGINAATTLPVIIRACTILGPVNGGAFVGEPAKALSIEAGSPQIVGCRIEGGNGTGGAGNVGIDVSGSARPFIYDCVISGGYVTGVGVSIVKGINVGADASAVVDACTIFGGSAVTSASSSPIAMGIMVPAAPGDKVVIANSVICGGYARSTNATYPGISYAVNSNCSNVNNYPVIVGCTIDSGSTYPVSGTSGIYAAIYSYQNSGYLRAGGNILTISGSRPKGMVVKVGYLLPFDRFAGNVAFGPFPSGSGVFFVGDANENQSVPPSTLPNYPAANTNPSYSDNMTYPTSPSSASVFIDYSMARVAGASTDFMYWLADNDWRPAAGMASYLAGAYNPVVTGDIPSADITAYPELLLDRSGKLRSATAPWARGAYTP
jgi:hypothetical protein